MSNLQTILSQEAQVEANEKCSDRAYEYKINRSLSLSFLRERLLKLYTTKTDEAEILSELKTLFVQNLVPVRPGRSSPRHKDKYRQRTKPKQFKNRRIVL